MLPAGWGSFYVSGFIGNIWNDELGRTEKSNYALGYTTGLARRPGAFRLAEPTMKTVVTTNDLPERIYAARPSL